MEPCICPWPRVCAGRCQPRRRAQHLADGNPQEGEDKEFQSALFDAVRSKTIPTDMSNGLGWYPAEVWAEWQDALVSGGDIAAPLEDLGAVWTNEFAAIGNEAVGG